MIRSLSCVIIVDDAPGKDGLLSEHGFSLWIEADDARILFDPGQSDALLHNARTLGIDLSSADAILLSHGHYDHSGGLAAVMSINRNAPVYCHADATVRRYSMREDGLAHEIGMPDRCADVLASSGRMRKVNRPHEIAPGIFLTGPVPRETLFENTGGKFFLDPEMKCPDAIIDDLSLMIGTTRGIVLVCGCCHSGIVNTVRYIQSFRPDARMRAIIGGLHLLNALKNRIEKSIEELSALRLEKIIACHCTGDAALDAMRAKGGEAFSRGTIGMKIVVSDG